MQVQLQEQKEQDQRVEEKNRYLHHQVLKKWTEKAQANYWQQSTPEKRQDNISNHLKKSSWNAKHTREA